MAPEKPGSDFDPQITLTVEPDATSGTSEELFIGSFIPLHNVQDFVDQETGIFETKGGQIAWLLYSLTLEGTSAIAMDYYIVTGLTGYILHCCCPKSEENDWMEHFRNLSKSIVIGG